MNITIRSLSAFVFAAAASAPSLLAQWQPVPSVTQLPYLTSNPSLGNVGDNLLLFGGYDGTGSAPGYSNWEWDGVDWHQVVLPVPTMWEHAFARDWDDGSVWLLGYYTDASLNFHFEVWHYDQGVWSLVPTTWPSGPVASAFQLVWDPMEHGLVLFEPSFTNRAYRLVNNTWVQLLSFAPYGGTARRLVADPVRGEVLLFGYQFGVWRLVGDGWQAVAPLSGPTFSWVASTFDSRRSRVIVAGLQYISGQALLRTYEWDGLHFTQLADLPVTSSWTNIVLAYHETRDEVVMSAVDNTQMYTYRLAVDPAPLSITHGMPCQDPSFTLALVTGDSPQPGTTHRLRTQGQNGAFVTLSMIGFSHTMTGSVPLPVAIPIGALGCELRVDPTFLTVLGAGQPTTQSLALPNSSSLVGLRYDAQFAEFDGSGVLDTSNAIEVQIGLPLPEHSIIETFANETFRDATASGDRWTSGAVAPAVLGGDGHLGSFAATLGTSLGNGVYQWNTDAQVVPASATLTGVDETITDGRFDFTDFVVPAGTTVRFVGNAPARLFVRGRVEVQGRVEANGADMPFVTTPYGPAAGEHLSAFVARASALSPVSGQPGGAPGCGGGRGGDGGEKCLSAGPIVVGGVALTDGQHGANVQVPAGHAYAAFAAGTGGGGSPMNPASGLPVSFPLIGGLYRSQFSTGGGGGGFVTPGAIASVLTAPASTQASASGAIGAAFPLLPLPAGYTSLDHFVVGGAGGGGGGSHEYGTIAFAGDQFLAGHGGTGGGGSLALRAGGDVTIGASGRIESKGGAGVLITGDNPADDNATAPTFGYDTSLGLSSPGGGGSGGSVLLQSGGAISVQGAIDVRGAAGSRTGYYVISAASLNLQVEGGHGGDGFFRLESAGATTISGETFPAQQPANIAAVADADQLTGSRSTWRLLSSTSIPVYEHYELLVDLNGVPTLFSDDASLSTLRADDPNGPAMLRFQGARVDAGTGDVIPSTFGPWRTSVRPGETDSLNRDRAEAMRFDLVVNQTAGPVHVLELRVLWH